MASPIISISFTSDSASWRLTQRVLSEESDPSTRIEKMYLEAFARPPELSEKKEALNFIAKLEIRYQPLSPDAKEKAWTDLCHVLLNTTEFMYIR